MKQLKKVILAGALGVLALALAGCGGGEKKADNAKPDMNKPVIVGVNPGPHAVIMENVKKIAEKKGLKIEIKEFSDFDIISIADHNSVKSCFELEDNSNVKCINGLEADATIEEYTFDYLCYGFNLEEVDDWVSKTFMTISERQQKIFDKLVDLCKTKDIRLDFSTEYDSDKEYAHEAIFRMLPNDFKEENELFNSYKDKK